MQQPVTGIILAGGKSTRFGSDKASALLAGRPLLQWVADALAPAVDSLIIVRATEQKLPAVSATVPITIVEDFVAARGPLAGLIAGLRACRSGIALVASCDAPLLQPQVCAWLVTALRDTRVAAAVPLIDGHRQTLVAAYRRDECLAAFEAVFASGTTSLQGAIKRIRIVTPGDEELRRADPGLRSFLNANRPADVAALEDLIGRDNDPSRRSST